MKKLTDMLKPNVQQQGQMDSIGHQDSITLHINPKEAAQVVPFLKSQGGSGRYDPKTGGWHFDDDGGDNGGDSGNDGGENNGNDDGGDDGGGEGGPDGGDGAGFAGPGLDASADFGDPNESVATSNTDDGLDGGHSNPGNTDDGRGDPGDTGGPVDSNGNAIGFGTDDNDGRGANAVAGRSDTAFGPGGELSGLGETAGPNSWQGTDSWNYDIGPALGLDMSGFNPNSFGYDPVTGFTDPNTAKAMAILDTNYTTQPNALASFLGQNQGLIGAGLTGLSFVNPGLAAVLGLANSLGKGNYNAALGSVIGGINPGLGAAYSALSGLASGHVGQVGAQAGSMALNSVAPGLGAIANASGLTGQVGGALNSAIDSANAGNPGAPGEGQGSSDSGSGNSSGGTNSGVATAQTPLAQMAATNPIGTGAASTAKTNTTLQPYTPLATNMTYSPNVSPLQYYAAPQQSIYGPKLSDMTRSLYG